MAFGKPAITDPRPPATRDTTQAVSNIRQRIEAIEAAVTALQSINTKFDTSGLQSQIDQLRKDLAALTLRVQTLEAEVPTDWYVDGVFVGTRHKANFIHGAGITITGSDDSTNERVDIRFDVSGVDLTLPVERTAIRILPRDIAIALGRFITTTQARIVIAGRSIGLSLSNDVVIDVDRAVLRLAGRSVSIAAGANVFLQTDRGALRAAGRSIGMGIGIPMSRAALRVGARDVALNPTGNVLLPVGRSAIVVAGRDVTVTPPSWTFFRQFSDLSTAGLTVYKGTVSAATGKLVGTPTSGAVHERVYFDALPSGSPSDISGAWTIEVHANTGSALTLNGILMNVQGDVSTDNTLQNGYWLDTLTSTNPRFVRFVAGGATVLKTAALGIANPSRLRVTYDGVNTFHCEANGTALFTDVVDSTFTHGRPGFVYFANPGTPGALIDFAMNYTP